MRPDRIKMIFELKKEKLSDYQKTFLSHLVDLINSGLDFNTEQSETLNAMYDGLILGK